MKLHPTERQTRCRDFAKRLWDITIFVFLVALLYHYAPVNDVLPARVPRCNVSVTSYAKRILGLYGL